MVGKGRKKLENKLIEEKSSRMVCFSKRRKGLFKKAEELSTLSGAKIGVLAFSQAGNLYSSDAETLDSLLFPQEELYSAKVPTHSDICSQSDISTEKEAENYWEFDFTEAMAGKDLPFWYNRTNVQVMGCEELQRLERAILEYGQMQSAKACYR